MIDQPSWMIVGFLVLLYPAFVYGANQESTGEPDLELLEFLGTWETEDGEWVNPNKLDSRVLGESDVLVGPTLESDDLGDALPSEQSDQPSPFSESNGLLDRGKP